jgi:hypothetical protein
MDDCPYHANFRLRCQTRHRCHSSGLHTRALHEWLLRRLCHASTTQAFNFQPQDFRCSKNTQHPSGRYVRSFRSRISHAQRIPLSGPLTNELYALNISIAVQADPDKVRLFHFPPCTMINLEITETSPQASFTSHDLESVSRAAPEEILAEKNSDASAINGADQLNRNAKYTLGRGASLRLLTVRVATSMSA